jgi:hypothetical protein
MTVLGPLQRLRRVIAPFSLRVNPPRHSPRFKLQGSNTCTEGQYISAAVRSYDVFVVLRTYYRCVRKCLLSLG